MDQLRCNYDPPHQFSITESNFYTANIAGEARLGVLRTERRKKVSIYI